MTWGQIFLRNTVFMGKIFVLPGANVSLYMINVVSRAPAAGGSSVAIATALALNDILRISSRLHWEGPPVLVVGCTWKGLCMIVIMTMIMIQYRVKAMPVNPLDT